MSTNEIRKAIKQVNLTFTFLIVIFAIFIWLGTVRENSFVINNFDTIRSYGVSALGVWTLQAGIYLILKEGEGEENE